MSALRVLVADNDTSLRKFVTDSIVKIFPNIEIEEAADDQEARTRLERSAANIVLCSKALPPGGGDSFLQWIRGNDATKNIPFIMIIEKEDHEEVVKSIHTGLNGYIVKPFTVDGLLQKMSTLDHRFDRRNFDRFEALGDITFYFKEIVLHGKLLDLSMGGALTVVSSGDPIPQILETLSLDMQLENGLHAPALSGFVIRMQSVDASPRSEFVKIAVKFLDNPEDKMASLRQLAASVTGVRSS